MVDHQLPVYLQHRQVQDFTDYASDGLGSALPPHVSIQGNTFTLVDATGQEFQPMPVMDCVIVDRSTVTCKMYYGKPYTPGEAMKDPPACFSTNGIGPSRDAPIPQARTCAECEKNVRGSAVSAISGASIKACRDEFHLAILLPTMPDIMFRYVLTPGSFKNWQAYTSKFKNSNVKISMVVTRMSFVPKVNGEIQFESVAYVDEATNDRVQQALLEKATDALVGRLDTPRMAAIAAPAIYGQVRPGPEMGQLDSPMPPLRMGASGMPAQQVQQPTPFVPSTPVTPSGSALGVPSGPSAAEPAPAQRRRRRTAAEMRAANGAAPQQAAPVPAAAPQAPFPHPGQQANTPGPAPQFGIAPGQPVAANPELAGMLDSFFSKG